MTQSTGRIIGEASRLDEQDQARFEAHARAAAHYTGMALEANLPAIRHEIETARQMLEWGNNADFVITHLDEALRLLGHHAPAQGEPILGTLPERNLVWEHLPNGEMAWLKADLTIKDRRP